MRIIEHSVCRGLRACVLVAACAEPVKITNIGHGYFSAALYIAKQEKIFEKYGLEPDISYVQGGALALQATLTKQADVGILSYEHVLTVAVQGKRIVAFYCVANRPVNNVIANDELDERRREAQHRGEGEAPQGRARRDAVGQRVGREDARRAGEEIRPDAAGRHQERLSRRRGAAPMWRRSSAT